MIKTPEETVEQLKKDVPAWNRFRRDAPEWVPDLSYANLRRAYLTDAYLPEIPAVPDLYTKMLAAIEKGGELDMSSWHFCKTTHCMAGWATTLAGEPGRVAESWIGPSAAGAFIINQSCPYLRGLVPDFYANNEDAMAFIKDCAAKEAVLRDKSSESKGGGDSD